MPVEIRSTRIITEHFIIQEGKPIDPAVYGLAHRNPDILSNLIEELRNSAAGLNNRKRRFVGHVADSLNAALVAIGNSEEA